MCDIFCPWFVLGGRNGGKRVVTGGEDGLDIVCGGCESRGFAVVGIIEEENFVFCGVRDGGGDTLRDETWYYTFIRRF